MADNVLHQLILNGKFEELEEAERLLKSPKGPELARQKDKNGYLPLHCVAMLHYTALACIISSTTNLLLQVHPEGLKEKNQNGDLPLHIISKKARFDLKNKALCDAMTNFLQIYPEGAGVKDGEGLLPIEHALLARRFNLVQLIATYYPKCLAIQACQCPLLKLDVCITCNDKHPLMTLVRKSGTQSIRHEKIIQKYLPVLNISLAVTHHPDEVHKILQLEDSLASEKQRVTEMQQHLDSEKQTRNTEHATLQDQVTKTQQWLDDDVHKNLQLEDPLASKKQQVEDLKLRVKDGEQKY
jgi:hypothetical protein